MSVEVRVLDIGMGNLRSVARALERAGAAVEVVGEPDRVRGASRLVVPGQGSFGDCSVALARGGFGEAIREHIASGRPYLGICLGMQLLFEGSDEADGRGLGHFAGRVRALRATADPSDPSRRLKVPHMGWNEVDGAHPLLPEREWFYFAHSFVCAPDDPELLVGEVEHGERFCAAVARENVFACQFHPEKSQRAGARLLERFLEGTWS